MVLTSRAITILIGIPFFLISSISASPLAAQPKVTLKEALELALQNNFELKSARVEIERAAGALIESRSYLLPQVVVSSQLTHLDQGRLSALNGQLFGATRSWRADSELQQPLFRGGENVARLERDSLLRKAAFDGYLSQLNATTLEVRERFYAVLLARSQVEVQSQSVELLTEQLGIERNKFQAGTVSELNILRAEVELANAQAPLIRARDDLRLAREELQRTLGGRIERFKDSTEAPDVIGELNFTEVTLDSDSLISAAEELRPEIRQLSLVRDARQKGITLERAAFFPTLLGYAGYGWESSQFNNDLSDINQGWIAGVRGEWRVFDSFRTYGRVEQAQALRRSAQIDLDRERENIDLEVRRAISGLGEASELVRASKKVVEQAEESLRLVRSRFDVGASPQIDVLDTQVALTQARTNRVTAIHAFSVARARLEKATGEQLAWFELEGKKGATSLREQNPR